MSKKEIRARGWCFTWNNWTPENRRTMETIECTYIVFGEEIAPTTLCPHLQGYIWFANARSFTSMTKVNSAIHWEVAKADAAANFRYCTKGANIHERGVPPATQKEKGDVEKERWTDILNVARTGGMAQLEIDYPKESVAYRSALKDVVSGVKRKLDKIEPRVHDWIYGPSDYGKSTYAREENVGEPYDKSMDKWWRNYDGQWVLIDDFDHTGAWLSQSLKRWLDVFPFPADIKFGGDMIRPPKVVITSQYLPHQIWKDKAVVAAIERRVNIIHLTPWQSRVAAKAAKPHTPVAQPPPPAEIEEEDGEAVWTSARARLVFWGDDTVSFVDDDDDDDDACVK